MKECITRRDFVRGTALGTVALSLGRSAGPAMGALGANECIRLGWIGCGGRGQYLRQHFPADMNVEMVAACDVDRGRVEAFNKQAGGKLELHEDYRRLLDRKDIDAVVVASPDHWHALQVIAALQAGKHVYHEKPAAHNIRESRLIVEAAQKANRVTQIGLQQRSGPHWQHAVERIRAGQLGKISMIHVWNAWDPNGVRASLVGNPPDSEPPVGVNYDLWLGPAPKRPFNPARFHPGWYYFWDYSGGMVTGWGVHLFDIVDWAVAPKIRTVSAGGGKFIFDDARDTPDTLEAVFECDGLLMTYSVKHGNPRGAHGREDGGIEFFGRDATLQIDRAGFQLYEEGHNPARTPAYTEKADARPAENLSYHSLNARNHLKNFIECIRTGKKTMAGPEVGHRATVPGQLANIAYRAGRKIHWDAEKETIPGDNEAAALLSRTCRPPYVL